MTHVCFYFQVHQPSRLRDYGVFDIGENSDYFDHEKNEQVMKKVARKCYLPTNQILLDAINEHDGDFKIAFSITGTAIEQFEQYAPEVLESFQDLADTGCVEFLSETYYHSLSFLYSKDEFKEQVQKHRKAINHYFDQDPTIFRHTELIYNNDVGEAIHEMGYDAVLAEGADHLLGWRSPNYVYQANDADIKLLLKNYKLSDDIAFRFSNKGWEEHPLTVEKYTHWLDQIQGETINLFMDYETFGEHHWEDTGILDFLRHLPGEILESSHMDFRTPSELIDYDAKDEIDVPFYTSWADAERDLSAWMGNNIQDTALAELYELEDEVKNHGDDELLESWRKMTTSDHFYYMCIKWFNDGDVHKYFNPYDSPYEAYIAFMNVLNDMAFRLNKEKREEQKIKLSEQPSLAVQR